MPNRPQRGPHVNSSQNWLQSPFPNLDALAAMSPGSTMSSFCLSTPGRFSPGRPPYNRNTTPGINYRMSPDTPFTAPLSKDLVDELTSPLFSPMLFSPYDSSVSRHRKGASKLSLVQDFHDVKPPDSQQPDFFSSLL